MTTNPESGPDEKTDPPAATDHEVRAITPDVCIFTPKSA